MDRLTFNPHATGSRQSVPVGTPSTNVQNANFNENVAQRTQDLINALSQNVVRPNPLDNEMSSSFGFLPKRNSFLGKRKLPTPKAGPATPRWKPFSFYLYLLNMNAETTPTPEEEFKLAQAGLGKRYINVSKDMSHDEFSRLLKVEYPKMWELTGGYYLYKATGGQGRRKLMMISPDFNEGYTGTLIRSVTAGGKNTLYAVPLQHEFDLTPLAPDALEFLRTPKEQCKICKVTYPLPILALHVQQCANTSEDDYDYDDEETCQSEVEFLSVTAAPQHHETAPPLDTKTSVEEVQTVQKVPCPICFMKFSPHLLEIHASMCGVSYLHGKEVVRNAQTTAMGQDNIVQKPAVGQDRREEQMKSVDEVLDTISGRVGGEKHFKVQISRTSIVERGLLQWQRQKKNSPADTLYVTFFGEAGVDSGALRKEFLTEMVAGIESRFFEGPQNRRIPRYSLTDYDRGLFRTVGEILAVSLAQGGPSPAFLSPWTYSYLCSGQMNAMDLNRSIVADAQSLTLIDKVESSTEESIKDQDLVDEIYNRGFTGSVSLENKESIVRSIILHASLRLQPMLDELTEGLKLYGLLEIIRKYPDICRPLFVPGEDIKVNADFFMGSIRPQLSEEGTNRHQVEMKMIDFLQDFLYEAEAEDQGHADDMEEPSPITPARLLQWITGQGHIPLLPSEKRDFGVVINFNHDCAIEFKEHTVCYPVVSACASTITLPVKHMSSSEQFKAVLKEAFYLGQEFSSV